MKNVSRLDLAYLEQGPVKIEPTWFRQKLDAIFILINTQSKHMRIYNSLLFLTLYTIYCCQIKEYIIDKILIYISSLFVKGYSINYK